LNDQRKWLLVLFCWRRVWADICIGVPCIIGKMVKKFDWVELMIKKSNVC
jgi:hypothetical protein